MGSLSVILDVHFDAKPEELQFLFNSLKEPKGES